MKKIMINRCCSLLLAAVLAVTAGIYSVPVFAEDTQAEDDSVYTEEESLMEEEEPETEFMAEETVDEPEIASAEEEAALAEESSEEENNEVQLQSGSTLKVGDYVKMGKYLDEDIIWRCIAIDEHGPLLLSDKILCIKPFDAKGTVTSTTYAGISSHSRDTYDKKRVTMGSSFWGDSNLRCWLNSDATSGAVTWLCGNPPSADKVVGGYNAYDNEAGFLNSFSEDELGAVKTVSRHFVVPKTDDEVAFDSMLKNTSFAPAAYSNDTFFCISYAQFTSLKKNIDISPSAFAYPTQSCIDDNEFEDITSAKIPLNISTPYHYWLSDGCRADSDAHVIHAAKVTLSGKKYIVNPSSFTAYGGITSGTNIALVGVRPACYLDTETLVLEGSGGETTSSAFIVSSNGQSQFHAVTGVAVSPASLTLDVGDEEQITAEITPSDADNKLIKYISSDEEVASVTDEGRVTAKTNGTVTISAITADGRYTSECTVKVGGDALTIGDYVRLGKYNGKDIIWRCAYKKDGAFLLIADQSICNMAYDAAGNVTYSKGTYNSHSSNPYRLLNGSSYWGDSNIRSWLNSEAEAGNVDWECGNAPDFSSILNQVIYSAYDKEPGFLAGFNTSEKAIILSGDVAAKIASVDYDRLKGSENVTGTAVYNLKSITDFNQENYNKAYTSITKDRVFLLSVEELNNISSSLGQDYTYGTAAYWIRDYCSYAQTPYQAKVIITNGTFKSEVCNESTNGVRPGMYVDNEKMLEMGFTTGDGTETSPYAIYADCELTGNHNIVTDGAVEATCTMPGITERTRCTCCGKVTKARRDLTKKGHTKVVDPAIPATSTMAGLTEGSHCSDCNTVLAEQNVVPVNCYDAVKTELGDDITIKVTQNIDSGGTEKINVYAALYDNQGKLQSIDAVNTTHEDLYKTGVTVNINKNNLSDYKIKVILALPDYAPFYSIIEPSEL